MKTYGILDILLLHGMLMIYSMSGICSKLAAGEAFLSFKFCMYYTIIIVLLGFYAIAWQQIIKRMPLTTAFANKAVTIIWGMIWGVLFFKEKITIWNAVGIIVIVCGIIMYSKVDGETENE